MQHLCGGFQRRLKNYIKQLSYIIHNIILVIKELATMLFNDISFLKSNKSKLLHNDAAFFTFGDHLYSCGNDLFMLMKYY